MGEQLQQENADQEVEEIMEEQTTAESQSECYSWPPAMRFDVPPYKTYHFYRHFRPSSNPNNFLKGVKWSPDGSCFLTSSDDNTLSVFALPDYENCADENVCSSAAIEDSFPANLAITEGEAIYDYCWYPYMSASDPVSCVFATTMRDHPIHLWDTSTGQLRCTYRAYDNMDEITAAFSIGFNPTGTKIFAGYNKSIRIFDIHRPGRDFEQRSTIQGNKEGQSGIISSIAFSPSHTGMLATGSYSQTTAIYREDNMEQLYVLHGQEGGVTHVQFSKDGNYLYTRGRKCPCQSGITECGFYVMKFMKEIVQGGVEILGNVGGGADHYGDEDMDAVCEEWSGYAQGRIYIQCYGFLGTQSVSKL